MKGCLPVVAKHCGQLHTMARTRQQHLPYVSQDRDARFDVPQVEVPWASVALALFLMAFGIFSFVLAWLHFTQRLLGKEQAVRDDLRACAEDCDAGCAGGGGEEAGGALYQLCFAHAPTPPNCLAWPAACACCRKSASASWPS